MLTVRVNCSQQLIDARLVGVSAAKKHFPAVAEQFSEQIEQTLRRYFNVPTNRLYNLEEMAGNASFEVFCCMFLLASSLPQRIFRRSLRLQHTNCPRLWGSKGQNGAELNKS